ncbi:MAG: glycosyl transferase family 1 [Rhizobium sp.]|nr:glycosyl transferase family 1 [Rhizobium sp.]
MRIAFVHQYFPGQFARLAKHFVDEGIEVTAFHRGLSDGRSSDPVDGVRLIEFGQEIPPEPNEKRALAGTERFIREAVSLARRADALRQEGWTPDVVYSHTGWGSAAYLHDAFPAAKFIKYCEWFYNNTPESTEFLDAATRPIGVRIGTSLMNMPILADLAAGDLLIAPTEFQKSQFPAPIRPSIEVAPDGVDMEFFSPDPSVSFPLPGGRELTGGDRVVTYVARGADPFRGFKPFLEALALLQARDPVVEALILGDRTVYYGAGHGTEDHFHEVMKSVRIDPARTHFLGKLDYPVYRDVLRISSAHVYLTVPFVLSWSMLESMATGCAVIGSDTAPVREFIRHGENGLLANFHDSEDIAARIGQALNGGIEIETMRANARRTIEERWSADLALARHGKLLARVLAQPK